MEFVWTQSALKDLENEETCPKRWYEQWIKKSFESKSNAVQNIGQYGEYLIIGQNAKSAPVTDLPRTSKGEKTAVQKRVEAQAEKVKALFNPSSDTYIGMQIKAVQVPLEGTIEHLPTRGTGDILAVTDDTNEEVLIDLKFTEDAFNTRTKYGWGNPIDQIDLIQQVLYANLYYQKFGRMPKVKLIIAEYGTGERIRNIDLVFRDWRVEEMTERFLQADEVVRLYQENGWITLPSEAECESCPIECPVRKIQSNLFTESYVY